ncbi:MAG TPA: GWxTD domain-containing protein [Candidatus Aminicenantes bacterium]|nr:GWxTD domain-containing protein [Candidatus Aminicenantes bacterium]HRY64560.1 GWxTD domain-containing protein [Candidatus Aminicenantes bacterium]HRZ71473.1 GWxTD domain-containing protein [Candidatus Aminicenantes bacterium]
MSKRIPMLVPILALALGLARAVPAPAAARQEPPRPKAEKARPARDGRDLDPIYQEFLKLTAYVISPKEREVFGQLPDNRDRDIFIADFWKIRDPTPGTPENEYKDEIEKRFAHVNKYFGAGRPGWMTDRGRVWMILGEPRSYDRFPGTTGIIPCEVWYYYTDGTKDLPTHFGLIFFQKRGFGEMKLYDPFVDGPKSLLEPLASLRNIDRDDYEEIYKTIRDFAPTLAAMAISLIPGEYSYGFQPTARNTELLASITEYAYKGLNPTYATHFFDFKGLVSTEYMTNYVENEGLAAVIRDPGLDLPFVHFSVVPLKLSVDYYEPKDQYFANFKVDVSLRRDEAIVFQNSKEYALYFAAADMERVRQNGVALEDAFPVCEGTYKLTVLVQNSVAKEFTVLERTITVPRAGGAPALNGPFLGYQLKAFPADVLIPFKTGERKLVVDPKMSYGSSDELDVLVSVTDLPRDLWQTGTVELSLKGQSGAQALRTVSLRLADQPYHPVVSLTPNLSTAGLPPDYYELTVRLLGPEKSVLDEKTAPFVLSSVPALAHPIANSRGFSLANEFYIYYQLARQYDKLGVFDKADAFFAKGLARNPGYKEGVSDYARFLVKAGGFDRALTVVEGLAGVEKGRFDYHLVRGLALLGLARYDAAVTDLLEANKIYDSDTSVLNALGTGFLKLGQKDRALAAYQASLKVNGDQAAIRKIAADLEKK